jgi:hypothetical protein
MLENGGDPVFVTDHGRFLHVLSAGVLGIFAVAAYLLLLCMQAVSGVSLLHDNLHQFMRSHSHSSKRHMWTPAGTAAGITAFGGTTATMRVRQRAMRRHHSILHSTADSSSKAEVAQVHACGCLWVAGCIPSSESRTTSQQSLTAINLRACLHRVGFHAAHRCACWLQSLQLSPNYRPCDAALTFLSGTEGCWVCT